MRYFDRTHNSLVNLAICKPKESKASILDDGLSALNRDPQQPTDTHQKAKYLFLISLGILLCFLAFAFNSPKELWAGSLIILTSPANLLTDYFQLANIGSALLNAGIMVFISIAMVQMNRTKITGAIIAAIFTVAGFSLFGKNLYNSLPIILGVLLYSRVMRKPFHRFLLQAFFGTALGPLVSEITFNLYLPIPLALALGMAAGILVGFILPPLSSHFFSFHQGFNLYNIGFTAGIIGTFFLAVLNGFGVEVYFVSILSTGNNNIFAIILYALFSIMLISGLYFNHWRLSGYRQLLAQSGKHSTDFVESSGFGLTLINMSLLGFLSISYVLAMGGELNGPIVGGIFTVVGFGAFGKHIRNVIPIFIGVSLANLFNISDSFSTSALLGALFGTTLAPIAGHYGSGYGVLAGILHMSLVMNVSFLHGGMNLYNNGFSGGFIAAALVPLIDTINQIKKERKQRNAS